MKRKSRILAGLVASLFLAGCTNSSSSGGGSGAGGAPAFDQSKLELVIPEMIRLMEAKDYVTVLKKFSTPEQLKMLTNGKPVEEAVKEMEPVFPMMLESLKKA